MDEWERMEVPVFAGITLPRQLPRAPYRDPQPAALAAVDADLVQTNLEYIKDCLEIRGDE
jgi:hypothetical protein